ncbi:hypothetical protein RN001_013354 [Aquatica leii]|uniref:Sodefrin-like factor n=1 Tax=Aquatica leii TaxID=1421715 RepID=A0AAN7PQI3_9COLE|nr:hypothetical protein RN001_013354 [Aquatica leii]
MNKIILFVALITSGNALKCYHCESDKENGCKQESKPEEITCGNPANNYKIVCAYKAFYEPNGHHHKVISGCETIPSNSPIDTSSIHNCEDEKDENSAENAYVIMAQTPVDKSSSYCLSIFGTNNRFTYEDVL